MRLLILGGTRFLGRAIAARALMAGHDVTCAARGLAGEVPEGARLIRLDRDESDGLAPLAGEQFDAVVDVSRHPGQVRRAVAALKPRTAHWTFVSTVSVYADNRTAGQRADMAPLRLPAGPEIEHSTEEIYGAAKVACEQAVGGNAFICRAGLIAGPEDPTGRFTYWPARLDQGGEVLVPGAPDDAMQLIDVRDLAQWIVHAAQTRLTGCFDGIGPSFTRGEFLAECASAVGSRCTFTWADRAFLEKHIDADRFLDFVSTRSPVFKERPLPKSKKEAIDLMMENPNLIKRPILIRGSKVTFGFDKKAYGG